MMSEVITQPDISRFLLYGMAPGTRGRRATQRQEWRAGAPLLQATNPSVILPITPITVLRHRQDTTM